MNQKHLLYLVVAIVALIMAGCGPQAAPEPIATLTPLPPTGTPTPIMEAPTPALSEGQVPMGFTEEGAPYRGNPNAPVTLVEHSEFQ